MSEKNRERMKRCKSRDKGEPEAPSLKYQSAASYSVSFEGKIKLIFHLPWIMFGISLYFLSPIVNSLRGYPLYKLSRPLSEHFKRSVLKS